MIRWLATIHYRTDAGVIDVQHALSEIEDLHDLVEAGPHWDTIERIEIVRAGTPLERLGLTVEAAARL